MWLLIDDCRDLGNLIARDGEIGLTILRLLKGEIFGVILDHDLGHGICGYEVLVKALEEDILPKHVQIVTSNPVGRTAMKQTLEANGYICRDNVNWIKPE